MREVRMEARNVTWLYVLGNAIVFSLQKRRTRQWKKKNQTFGVY